MTVTSELTLAQAGHGDGDWRSVNLANWNDRVPIHMASAFYDTHSFLAGADTLRPFEASEAGDVRGKRLVHLQCHIGLDTLSWARRGALVSGLDFSPPAIRAATSLATEAGIDASFAVADVYDAAAALGGQRFDVVYTGTGALVWLPDLPRWARVVASLLAPGGFLYLVEGHPLAQVLDSACGAHVVHDYFDPGPHAADFASTYTDGPEVEHTRIVRFRHSMGSVITALAGAGLRIEFLNEYDFDVWARFEALRRCPDGLYRLPAGRTPVPMLYSLRASAPALSAITNPGACAGMCE
jgi:2-polyprenyl-3-methyl-5-hydroxy-6-metoxy-1,4-benzoquinol methylase